MAWSSAEGTRINTLEEFVNSIATQLLNLVSKEQMRQLLLIKQREIDSLSSRLTALEAQIQTLQNQLD